MQPPQANIHPLSPDGQKHLKQHVHGEVHNFDRTSSSIRRPPAGRNFVLGHGLTAAWRLPKRPTYPIRWLHNDGNEMSKSIVAGGFSLELPLESVVYLAPEIISAMFLMVQAHEAFKSGTYTAHDLTAVYRS